MQVGFGCEGVRSGTRGGPFMSVSTSKCTGYGGLRTCASAFFLFPLPWCMELGLAPRTIQIRQGAHHKTRGNLTTSRQLIQRQTKSTAQTPLTCEGKLHFLRYPPLPADAGLHFTDAASNQVHLTTDEGCTAEANSGSTTCCCPRTQELHKCGREQIVLQPLPADAGAPHVRRVQQPGAAVD